MAVRFRSYGIFVLLALGLVALNGCGSRPQDGQTGQVGPAFTPIAATPLPQAVASAHVLGPRPVQTGVPGIVPDAEATSQTRRDISSATPPPIPNYSPHGDSLEAETALKRWQTASYAVSSLRGSQSFSLIEADGTRSEPPCEPYHCANSTDEWYDRIDTRDSKLIRLRLVMHGDEGDSTVLYDGAEAYRTSPGHAQGPQEIYRPWPDSSNIGMYWEDYLDGKSMLSYLLPPRSSAVLYSFIGEHELDGREVIELLVREGNVGPNGVMGTHVYLDKATYLPYRYTIYDPDSKLPEFECTFLRLEVNTPLIDADFRLQQSDEAITIYEHNQYPPKMPVYTSLQEAQKEAEFALFGLPDWAPTEVVTSYLVQKSNKRTPVLRFSLIEGITTKATIMEGVYIPALDESERFGLIFTGKTGVGMQAIPVDIDGQPAEWRTFPSSQPFPNTGAYLKLERDGTQIEVRTSTKEEAIEIARQLVRVK